MKQIIMQAEQVLNRMRDQVRDLQNKLKEKSDDSAEAQAQTFRIWMWSSAAGLSLIVIVSVLSSSRENEKAPNQVATEKSILDQLPDGYVVAPIEPANLDSLDSIFDQQGYADLYRSSLDGEKGRRLARGLPLIRAPRNPKRFAVVVSETQASILSELNEPVVVILRKGPAKPTDDVEPQTTGRKKKKRESPLVRDSIERIDIIEEEIPAWPDTAESKISGVNL